MLDVEEDIWSPMFGLKGKVDVSVELELLELSSASNGSGARRAVSDNSRPGAITGRKTWPAVQQQRGGAMWPARAATDSAMGAAKAQGDRTLLVAPVELKTGKAAHALEHRAQTILYTLLMGERYGELPSS